MKQVLSYQAHACLEHALHSMQTTQHEKVANIIGAKSSIPGFSRSAKPLPKTGRGLPVERDESVKEVQDEREVVSLHAYLKIAKGVKLTPADLDKAEKKATKEGNEAILKRIASSRRFVERKPNKDAATGKKVSRGFAVYRGIQVSPKAPGKKALKCVAIGWGYIDYFYLPTDGRTNVEAVDRKLSAAFKSNPTGAGVMVNELVRFKKLEIYVKYDRANKKVVESIPKNVVANVVTGSSISPSSVAASISSGSEFSINLFSDATTLVASVNGQDALDLIATGSVDLRDITRSTFSLLVRRGEISTQFSAGSAPSVSGINQAELDRAYASVSTNDVGPTKMYKERNGSGSVRTIEASGTKISLREIDWNLVKAVADAKLPKALVDGQQWRVTCKDNLLSFVNSKSMLRVSVNADLVRHKLS